MKKNNKDLNIVPTDFTESPPESMSEPLDDQFSKLSKAMENLQDNSFEIKKEEIQTPAEFEDAIEETQQHESPLEAEESSAPFSLDPLELQSSIEALIFIAEKPISLRKIHEMMGPESPVALFEEALQALIQRFQSNQHGIELIEVAGGFQFRTKPEKAALAKKLAKVQTQRLSSGAMETLAIIAYQQPVMKEEIDKIRGVDSSYFVRNLIERKLIKISGRSELPGRPILYATTDEFLEIFGLMDLSSLPSLRELEQMVPGSETRNPEDEDPRIREMRRLVGDMKLDRSSALSYNPKEDEIILKEIRERVVAIPTSTPYLEELEMAEKLAQTEANQEVLPEAEGEPAPEAPPAT